MSKCREEEHDNSSQISERCSGFWRTQIFYLYHSKCILANRYGLERKITTLFIYRNSGKNHSDITYCTLFQQVVSHLEKDQGNLK